MPATGLESAKLSACADHAAERQHLAEIRRDPVAGAADAIRHLRADRRQHRLDALPGAIGRGSVAMTADVEQILEGTVRREIRTAPDGVDTPTRALPGEEGDERFEHRGRGIDGVVRAHQRDPDGVGVVVDGVRAAHVGAEALSRVGYAAGVVLGPATFVDPTVRIDEPVVRDVDVLAGRLVREDPAAQPGVVGDVVRRTRVMHDDLRDVRVVAQTRLAQTFVGTPLRPRDDRRHRPVRHGREYGTGVGEIDGARAADMTRDVRSDDRRDTCSGSEL